MTNSEHIPNGQVSEADGHEAKWRELALQFDGHRIDALSHLKYAVRCIEEYATVRDILREPLQTLKAFLAAPPLSGEKVLAARLDAITRRSSAGVKVTDEMCRLAMIELSAHWERNTQPTMEIARSVLTAALPSHAGEDDKPVAEDDVITLILQHLGASGMRALTHNHGPYEITRCNHGVMEFVRALAGLRPSPSVPPHGETSDFVQQAYDILNSGEPPYSDRECKASYALSRALASQTQGEGDVLFCPQCGWNTEMDEGTWQNGERELAANWLKKHAADMRRLGRPDDVLWSERLLVALTPFPTLEPSDAEVERALIAYWGADIQAHYVAMGMDGHKAMRAALIASRQPTSGERE